MSTLEARYRRLLALFPAAHRRRYQEEMLATLLDGADPGQRSPRRREVLDLLGNALLLRLTGRGRDSAADPHWAGAAGVFGYVAACLLAGLVAAVPLSLIAYHLRAVPMAGAWNAYDAWQEFAIAGLWALAAGCATLRAGAPSAATAWVATACYVSWHLPSGLVGAWPMIVLSLLAAGSLSRRRPPIQQTVGRKLTVLFGAAGLAVGSALWVDVWLLEVHRRPGHLSIDGWGGNFLIPAAHGMVGVYPLLVYGFCLILFAFLLANVAKPVRQRIVLLLGVPCVMFAVVRLFYGEFVGFGHFIAISPTAPQWLPLLALPPLLLALGSYALRRRHSSTVTRSPSQ